MKNFFNADRYEMIIEKEMPYWKKCRRYDRIVPPLRGLNPLSTMF
jgi:hypothetical protein